MSVGYTKEQCLHMVRGRSKLLEEVVKNMVKNQQEILMHLTSTRVDISSFAEDPGDSSMLQNTSTVSYEAGEFEAYTVSETKLIFAMRE